jgi:DNA adenine methylase
MKAAPIIPWIGAKRRLAKYILPLFPDHTCYVEPFAGAAALFFNKPAVKAEVLNDINGDLVNLYRVVKNHLDEFMRQFRWALTSREIFKWLQATPSEVLTDIQRAARFYYLQRLAFGGRVESRSFGTATTSGPRINLLRIEEDLSEAHLRLSQATIEHLPWQECVERYDREHTLFYLDPPYWGTEGYGVAFPLGEYDRIAQVMRSIKGKAIVSVNDVREMRAAFSGFRTQRLTIRYTVGGGGSPAKKTGELVIRSW